MLNIFRYLFWPNPGFASYSDPDIIAGFVVCAGLLILSFGLALWRRKQGSSITRKLSSGWSSAAFWFGLAGIVMLVSRVEDIQFVAMRFLWVMWTVLLLLYVFVQVRRWRQRHYEVLPTVTTHDPRDPYLPKSKKRR